jgi:hypothetical protein
MSRMDTCAVCETVTGGAQLRGRLAYEDARTRYVDARAREGRGRPPIEIADMTS